MAKEPHQANRNPARPAPVGRTDRLNWIWAAICIGVLGLIAYLPALHGDFIWDDDSYVSDNKAVLDSNGLGRIWSDYTVSSQYYPLVYTTYWIEHRLWGLDTLGYHVTNLLLHLFSAILLGRLLKRLNVPGAWLAAAVFAVHPVNVESVAWITERKNVLSGVFYFLALTAYARFSGLPEEHAPTSRKWGLYGLAVGCFVFALLSKTVTASLPAVILLLLWWKRGRWDRTDLAALAPMFVIGAAMGYLTVWIEQHHIGAKGEEWNLSLLERCLLAGRAPWFYASKIIAPYKLSFIYPRWKIDALVAWQYAFPAALLATMALLWAARNRIGRAPLTAALCFVGTLVPAIGFFNVFPFRYSFVADHFQYLAGGFLIVLIIALAARATSGFPSAGRIAGASLLVLVLTALSREQSKAYRGMESLWRDTVAKNPQAWMAHANLGDFLSGKNNFNEAISCYDKALTFRPPDAHQIQFNRGLVLEKLGRPEEALKAYYDAINIKANYPEAHVNIGIMLCKQGKTETGLLQFDQALRLKPDLAAAHYNLGNVLVGQGRIADGRRHLQEAIRYKPDYTEAWVNEAGAAWVEGKLDEAVTIYRDILRRDPACHEAAVNLGAALVQMRKVDEGLALLRQAVGRKPADIEARLRLIQALAVAGQLDEAKAQLQEAARRAPDHPQVKRLLESPLAKPAP